ncbi:MAG TPA: molybdopterin dinucleotide binding domain-containing protein, partial [Bryobacteraceae bacterium]|nr:molybdopterin dinucleotide binding domain-containing protein [Bryobacteraceae bacterium]
LLPPAPGVTGAAEFLAQVAAARGLPDTGAEEPLLKARAASVFSLRRGEVFSYATGSSTPLASFESADKFWTALVEGACWIDSEAAPRAPRGVRLLGRRERAAERLLAAAEHPPQPAGEFPVTLAPRGWSGAIAGAPSPLQTKLYQESGLRPPAGEAVVHPETARACGIEAGGAAVIESACGTAPVRVRVDQAALPGAIEVAAVPAGGALDACPARDCTWRLPAVRIRRAS